MDRRRRAARSAAREFRGLLQGVAYLAATFALAYLIFSHVSLGQTRDGAQMQHDHSTGSCDPALHWYMTDNCCNCRDCRQISGADWSEVKVTIDGYVWSSSKSQATYSIPFGSPKIKISQDGFYHGCEYSTVSFEAIGGVSNVARCLFVPPMGSMLPEFDLRYAGPVDG